MKTTLPLSRDRWHYLRSLPAVPNRVPTYQPPR